ncbi:hypothetical protein CHARACLAT_002428 [Characodon lateralis]|uniref:C-type lectin domain-containing protein n=1 Tax=Characodon lateralis TaxID=208331 RepID=A0ABU7DFP4_9TELE|nr:hypothetical protein [Characodon lateralis]
MGGNLASIPSRHVEVFLLSEMVSTPTTDLWIGFHSTYEDGFYWTDGRPKSYVNLRQSEHHIIPPFLHIPYHDRYLTIFEDDIRQRFESNKDCAVINTNSSLGIGKWVPKSCNDMHGFICLKDVEPIGHDPLEPTTSNNYFKILNDSIKLVPQQMSWDAAQKHCEAEDAKLTSVRTEWTQAYIELLAMNLKRPLWIGLNKALTNNYFRYIDGWPMISTYWGNNEPHTDGICVYVDVDGKWKTNNCSQNISSVCMKSTDTPPRDESKDFPGVCPEDPDPINPWRRYSWKPFRGFCYIFFSEMKEWPNAAADCIAHGGILASIADPSEQEFIQNNIGTFQGRDTSYWLGLFKTHKGEWLWLDKTVMDYSNWQSGQPRYKIYGLISVSDGRWGTGNRWNDRPYICKTAKVLLSVPSPKPHVDRVSQGRGRTALTAVLVIAGIAMGAGIAFFLFKKSGHHIPTITVPNGLTAFDNPLFNSSRSQPDLVDSKNLVGNADEDDTQPVITI